MIIPAKAPKEPRPRVVASKLFWREATSMHPNFAKSIIVRYIEQVVNTGNLERISEFIDSRYIDHNDPLAAMGVGVAERHVQAVRSTFPDLLVTIEEQIAEGDLVVTRCTARATHQGEWLNIRPTNKPIVIPGINIDRIKDGKIVEHWGVADTLQALLAIDALVLPKTV
jgi:predicted ester cyclase